jgi:hypothetical protein
VTGKAPGIQNAIAVCSIIIQVAIGHTYNISAVAGTLLYAASCAERIFSGVAEKKLTGLGVDNFLCGAASVASHIHAEDNNISSLAIF